MSSITDHFREFYHGDVPTDVYTSRVPPALPTNVEQRVDLENIADKYFFKPHEQHVSFTLDKLIDKDEHEKLTTHGYSKIGEKGFKPLYSFWGSVWEHKDLDGWLLKTSNHGPEKPTWADGRGGRCSYLRYNNLHRVILADRMRNEVAENHWDIVIPDKRLYRSPHAQPSDTIHKKFYPLSKKLELDSYDETWKRIGFLTVAEQRRLVIPICDLIKRSGLADANSGTILALKRQEGKRLTMAVVDTEPMGLIKDTTDRNSNKHPNTFENCVKTGLSKFDEAFGLKYAAIKEEVELAFEELEPGGLEKVKQKRLWAVKKAKMVFIAKLIVSIIIPIIPLIVWFNAIHKRYNGDVGRYERKIESWEHYSSPFQDKYRKYGGNPICNQAYARQSGFLYHSTIF